MTTAPIRSSVWQPARLVLVLALCLLLVACGFTLRGTTQLSPAMEQTHINHADGGSLLALDIAEALQRAGSEILLEPRPGAAILEIQREVLRRRVVAVGPDGRAQEFQMQLQLSYRVTRDDDELLAPQSLTLTREFSAGLAERVLGRESEADQLAQDMRNDAVRLIMRRLERVPTSPPEPAE